ncbi:MULTISPECIES: class I adenylate-forming enzyme family protein [unclassified Pseudomonas]|uniref:class I adenylate-forming enzyme family protein n=1 Tax=unclassified Pseudomonas TaxID=196821 RepID=UPI0025CFB872|nr:MULTISPECIES: AMP-binding protein [unclassified Pseudomonas]
MKARDPTLRPQARLQVQSRGRLLRAPTFWQLLQSRAACTPHATMLIDGERGLRITFAQVHDIAQRLAAGLHALGIRSGSTVTWQLPTGSVAVVTALALARLGAVQNPVIWLYGARELATVLARSQSQFLLIDGSDEARQRAVDAMSTLCLAPALIPMSDELPQGEPSSLEPFAGDSDGARWVYYTSGTTSQPKGAMHSDNTLMLGGLNLARAMQVGSHDVGSIAFPYAHIGGAMYTAMLLASGMSAVLVERFQAAKAVRLFAHHRVTTTGGSTAHYQALLAEQRGQPERPLLPAMRLLCGGGAFCPAPLHEQVRAELGCTLTHNYGMTEIPLICAGTPSDSAEALAGSCGLPVEGVEMRVVGKTGVLPSGAEGEIRVRGPAVFLGYTDQSLMTEAFDEDGFFRTGDLGRVRPDGRVVLTGRLKDVIIRKGENISALELEEILQRHDKVAAAAVIGLPDAQRGERVCAVIEPAPGQPPLTYEEMVGLFLSARVMVQKIPEQLEIVDPLPRNDTMNKILKHELRARFSSSEQPPLSQPSG